jgi:hypothetical protein
MSIEELNATTLDDLREKFNSVRRDDRGPVETFLDLLDTGRNQILTTLAPGLEKRARAKGNVGTGGTGRVYFSDVLGEMGMEPGLARGVLGFAGDIAFDPLTYLGPPGWGAKVATTGGRAVRVGLGGTRALKAGEKAVKSGGTIADDAVRGLYEAAGKPTNLRAGVMGDLQAGRGPVRKVGRGLGKVIGMEEGRKGGLIAQYADEVAMTTDAPEVAQRIQAVDAFLQKYGKGANPGIRIGKDAKGKVRVEIAGRGPGKVVGATSAVGHIPFTDIALNVPAFTADAISSARTLAMAAATGDKIGVAAAATSPKLQQMRTGVDEVNAIASEMEKLAEQERKFRESNADAITRLSVRGEPDQAQELPLYAQANADPDEPVARQLAEFRTMREGLAERIKSRADEVTTLLSQPEKYDSPKNIGQILAMKRMRREFEKSAAVAIDRLENIQEQAKLRSALKASESERLDDSMDVLRRLAQFDEATKKGGSMRAVNYAEGADLPPDLSPESGFVPPPEIDDALTPKAKRQRLEEIKAKLKGLSDDSPLRDDLLVERDLLRARRTMTTETVGNVAGEGKDRYTSRPFLGFYPPTGETVVNAHLDTIGEVSARVRPLLDEYEDAVSDLAEAQRKGDVTRGQSVAGESMNDLRERVDTLRDQLVEATAPLRQSHPMEFTYSTLDEVTEAIKANDRAQLTEANRRLLDMTDAEADIAESVADALHKSFRANLDMALATRTSAVAFLTPEQKRVLQLHKQFLGTEDSITGSATLAPIGAITDAIFGGDDGVHFAVRQRIGEYLRARFGGHNGEIADAARYAHYMADAGSRRAVQEFIAGAAREFQGIAAKHGMESQIDTLLAVAMALAYKARQTKAGKSLVHPLAFGTKEPAGWALELERAMKAGLLAPDSPLAKDIEAFVAKHTPMLDEMRDIAREGGMLGLGGVREGYIANVATPAGRKYMERAKRNDLGGGYGPAQQARLAGLQAFQKQRMTDSARFKSAVLGRDVEVFEGDRWVQTLTDAEIEAIPDTNARARIAELKGLLDEYDAMPARPPMLGNDPFTINQHAKEGRFALLLGSDEGVPGGFMDTNFLTMLASRLGQHERAVAKQSFLDTVVSQYAFLTSPGVIKRMANAKRGQEIDLGNGLVGKIIPLGGNMTGVQVGNDVFRGLRDEIRSKVNNPMIEQIGGGRDAIYDIKTAELIENAAGLYEDSKASREFWTALDRLTGAWKTVTLAHPSWWIGNVTGESINFQVQDANFVVALGKYGKRVAQMFKSLRDPERLTSLKMTVNGAETTGAELAELIDNTPVVGASLFGEPAAQSVERDLFTLPSRLGNIRESATREAVKHDRDRAMEHYATATGNRGWQSQAKAAGKVTSDRFNRYFKEPWFRINQRTSDMLRVVAYLSLRDQGIDHLAAVERVKRAGFDYQSLTSFESNWARRVFPFYTWLKNNSIYQAKMLMERPIYVGMFPSLYNAIEEATAGEERVPLHARPQWMRENLALQVGGKSESRVGLTLGTFLPQEQAMLLGRMVPGVGGIQDAAKQLTSSINPAIRTPLEIGFGKEAFSNRTIGDPIMSDLSIPEHIAGQVRPLREIPKLTRTVGEQGVAPGVARAFLGGRVQPMTDDRLASSRGREFREEDERYRRSIRKAEAQGDKARSLILRARQLKLYEQMMQAGFAEDVPAWARKQVQEMGAA